METNQSDGVTSESQDISNVESHEENQEENGSADDDKSGDKVDYKTFKKLLSQRKADQERIRELTKAQKELSDIKERQRQNEEAKLRKQGEFEKLLESEREKTKKLLEENETYKKTEETNMKLHALFSNLDGHVDKKYWGHFRLDNVIIDPTSGEVDETSVANEIERFKKEHPILIGGHERRDMPNDQPRGSKLTYDAWLKLPPKEMKKRRFELMKGAR